MPVQVVSEQLPWEEEEEIDDEIAGCFINKSIRQCRVFLRKEYAAIINIIMELSDAGPSNNEARSSLVRFSASSDLGHMGDHYSSHTFLSDSEGGHVLESFPRDMKIVS